MLSFLKVFARGLVCTLLLPLILAVWVLYGAYCLIIFIIMFFKSLILFFTGEKISGEMKEDIEAKKILLEKEQTQVEQAQLVNMMYQNMAAQQQIINQTMMQQHAKVINPTQNNDFNPFGEDPVSTSTSLDNQGGGNGNV